VIPLPGCCAVRSERWVGKDARRPPRMRVVLTRRTTMASRTSSRGFVHPALHVSRQHLEAHERRFRRRCYEDSHTRTISGVRYTPVIRGKSH